jgi:uncharacterized protein YecE (DUF72 family)
MVLFYKRSSDLLAGLLCPKCEVPRDTGAVDAAAGNKYIERAGPKRVDSLRPPAKAILSHPAEIPKRYKTVTFVLSCARMSKLYAGTSGFAYSSWKPDFYPKKLASKDFLGFYAQRVNSTEVNYTFRQLPKLATLESWVAATPPEFVFSLKAHMRLTHILKLANAGEFLEVFLRAVDPLRSARRLGPILFQLPPHMRSDPALLREFLTLLPADLRYTFEFRHESWLCDEVYSELSERQVALCLAESEKLVVPQVITAPFVYARLRKPDYTVEDRAEIARRAEQMLASGKDLYVYFKHEETPAGVLYAEELLRVSAEKRASA